MLMWAGILIACFGISWIGSHYIIQTMIDNG